MDNEIIQILKGDTTYLVFYENLWVFGMKEFVKEPCYNEVVRNLLDFAINGEWMDFYQAIDIIIKYRQVVFYQKDYFKAAITVTDDYFSHNLI